MEYSANTIIDNYNRLVADRAELTSRVDRCRQYVNPGRSRQQQQQHVAASQRKPQQPDREIITNALARAALIYARGMSSNLFPPSSKWFSFGCRENKLLDEFLGAASQGMYDLLYSSSNFSSEMNECIEDTADAGTVCISCERDPERGLRFKNHDFSLFYVEESAPGKKDIVYRLWPMTALQAVNFFNEPGDNIPPKMREDGTSPDNGRSGRNCRIIHAVIPNRDREYADDGTPKPGKRNKRYLSFYVDIDEKAIIRTGGYERCPYIVGNIDNPATGIYSDSPMLRAKRSAELLNVIYVDLVDAGECAIKPSVALDLSAYEDIIPEYFFEPGQVNLYDGRNGQARPPQFYVPPANLPFGADFVRNLGEECETFFATDLFTMITRLNQENGRQRTAYEIQQLAAERNNMILPLVARFLDEVVSPLLRLAFFTALDAGLYPLAPPEAKLLTERDVQLQYYSPLALAAQRNKVNGTLSAIEQVLQLAQILGPELLDVFDMDVIVRDIAKSYGAYPEHLRKEKAIEDLRAKRAQAAQTAQMGQQLTEVAKSQDLTRAVDRTSLAGGLVNGGAVI